MSLLSCNAFGPSSLGPAGSPTLRAGPDPRVSFGQAPSERARLAALRGTGLLDTPPEETFDRLVKLAASLLRAPVALVSLVDEHRQFFKASHGLPYPYADLRETPLSHSFCRNVAVSGTPLVVPDTLADRRLRANPGIRALGIRAYLGVPLTTEDGHVLGSLCVIDTVVRKWSEADLGLLCELGSATMAVIRLRGEVEARSKAEREAAERSDLLEHALEMSGRVGLWHWDVAGKAIVVDRHFARMMGTDPARGAAGIARSDFILSVHPDDRDLVREVTRAALKDGMPRDCEYRIVRPDGTTVWVQSRGGGYGGGDVPARFAGVVADVTAQKTALEHQEGISGELAHRVKNMMATVQAVVMQTLREAPSLREASAAVGERLGALARAHDLLVPKGWAGADIVRIVQDVADTFGQARFDVSGPPVLLEPRLALAMAMALHELSTNAVKYGALSNETGRVRLSWTGDGDRLTGLTWIETGGPPVAEPTRLGFGSKLLSRVLASEVGGDISLRFEAGGVECRVNARPRSA